MSNQMKKILTLSFVFSGILLALSSVMLLVAGQLLSPLSYVILGVSGGLFILLLNLLIFAKKEENIFRKNIAYYRILNLQREKAILGFYNKFGVKPQYNKDGRLLTPDEFLGILTSLDKDGKLDPSIYEKLGILPKFDENGKEIPQIMVLKHLIRSIKKDGLNDISKLKGLYKKGTRQEKEKTEEKKAEKADNKKNEAKKSKSAKVEKINRYGSKDVEFKNKLGGKKSDKKNDNKASVKEPPKAESKKPEKVEEKQEPLVVEQTVPAENKRVGSDYLNQMYNKKPESNTERIARDMEREEEFGEGSLE